MIAAVDDPDTTALTAAVADLYPTSLLVGYVVVAEWVDPDGSRDLSRHAGPHDPPDFDVRKWLSEGLSDWGSDGED